MSLEALAEAIQADPSDTCTDQLLLLLLQVGEEGMSLEALAEAIQVDPSDIMRTLFMKGIMLSMNQVRAHCSSMLLQLCVAAVCCVLCAVCCVLQLCAVCCVLQLCAVCCLLCAVCCSCVLYTMLYKAAGALCARSS
jgi:hypothetical protein